MALFICKRA
jgi:hypothetical protein